MQIRKQKPTAFCMPEYKFDFTVKGKFWGLSTKRLPQGDKCILKQMKP